MSTDAHRAKAHYGTTVFDPEPVDTTNGSIINTNHAGDTNGASGEAIKVKCGPLLNYKRLSNAGTPTPTWHGSVLIVTVPGEAQPELSLHCLGPASSSTQANGISSSTTTARKFPGEKLYEDPRVAFWRFLIDLPLQEFEAKWEYNIPNLRHETGDDKKVSSKTFFVPQATHSMRIMFHSCNGFSVGTDMELWTGPNLWNDVLRQHKQKPIHVMIGGGDQIYNDAIRVTGPLKPWTDIANPHKRRDFPFGAKMRAECDDWYLNNYIDWYRGEPFCFANGNIPQVNVWDDHDIIDGFGSYTDHFMKCPVFRGIGSVAYKYYCLFQHHIPPSQNFFTTNDDSIPHDQTTTIDPEKLRNAYVMTEKAGDPMFVFGDKPGPYVEERSRSIYTQLGANIAMMGIDARTERTRHQINYPETYEKLFAHASKKLTEANGQIRHFILLLGVPIAYPRLQWLENILQSPIVGPIRFMSKRFGVGGGLFNNFDGNVDLLDDLDDHYTAHQHKKERKALVEHIQALSKKHSVRVTILGGDVHLAALGRFYSSPKLDIPVAQDHRYMPNIVSSAITNKPPPGAVANLLARRNKIHHLDHDTDETLLNLFDKDPGELVQNITKKSADANHCTMPSRNFALISESQEHPGTDASANGTGTNGQFDPASMAHHNTKEAWSNKGSNPRNAMHLGEKDCGHQHPAASGVTRTGLGGAYGLDVAFRVEIDSKDREGKTVGYGFTIPTLEKKSPQPT